MYEMFAGLWKWWLGAGDLLSNPSSVVTNRPAADKPPPTPIRDDETGRYNMLSLDGFLVNPTTMINDLN